MLLASFATPSTTLSKISFSTKSREPAQQPWPWVKKIALAAPRRADSTSASSSTMLGDFRGTCQGNFVDIGMSRQGGARRFSVARHDVHYAVGNSGFLQQFAKQKRAERRLFRGLQHDRAAAS